jgi:uncharacterized membrane protein
VRALLTVVVALLVAIGAAAAVAYFHHPLFNSRFAEFPAITRFHVILGGIYLTLAPLQFVTGGRRRALGYHRAAGRMLVAAGTVVGITATFILLVIPGGGVIPGGAWREQVFVTPFAVFFVVALAMSVRHIRAGRVALHREWMIRAFAVGLAIATQRVFFVIGRVAVVGPRKATAAEIVFLMLVAFVAAFFLHVAVAEAWIRAGRPRRRTVQATPTYAPVDAAV